MEALAEARADKAPAAEEEGSLSAEVVEKLKNKGFTQAEIRKVRVLNSAIDQVTIQAASDPNNGQIASRLEVLSIELARLKDKAGDDFPEQN